MIKMNYVYKAHMRKFFQGFHVVDIDL